MTRMLARRAAAACVVCVAAGYGLTDAPPAAASRDEITSALFEVLRQPEATVQPFYPPSPNATDRFVVSDGAAIQYYPAEQWHAHQPANPQ